MLSAAREQRERERNQLKNWVEHFADKKKPDDSLRSYRQEGEYWFLHPPEAQTKFDANVVLWLLNV